jgi:hypothetical protein
MKDFFRRDGVAKKVAAIPLELLARAESEVANAVAVDFHDQLFSDQMLAEQYPAAFLLQGYAQAFCAELIGSQPLALQNQLAVRRAGSAPWAKSHIDGNRMITSYGSNWNQMPLFQVIVGVPLVTTSTADLGNVVVYPGAHHLVARFIEENWDSLAAEPDVHIAFRRVFDYCNELGVSEQTVLTELGDIYAMHALMPHRALANNGPQRPVWYFRFGYPQLRGRRAFRSAFPEESWS